MATVRTVNLWEGPEDLTALARDRFSFNIAKSVIDSSGRLTFNMVWQSVGLAPRWPIRWDVKYCLNFALRVPAPGAQCVLGSRWRDCHIGKGFDLNKYGEWEPSTSDTLKPGYLNVGKNNYDHHKSQGIHIVVGVRTADGSALPIYIDTVELALGKSSWYQPQEQVQWWYERGTRSSTMISDYQRNVQTWDMSQPRSSDGKYSVSTTYKFASGIWVTNNEDPPPFQI